VSEKILHKELSYRLNGCVFDVHNEVGPGLREECYQKAFEHRLEQAGIPFVAKPATRRDLRYRDVTVHTFEPDLVVAEAVIPELKHQVEGFAEANYTQLLSYLKFWQLRLGLLINFAMNKAVIERVPDDPRTAEPDEHYEHITDVIRDGHRPVLQAIRTGLLTINRVLGLGYPDTIYRNLAIVEFRALGLRPSADVVVTPEFRDRMLPSSAITPLVVDRLVCVEVQAIHDEISARAVRTMQTHLRLTGCDVGVIASFGRTRFRIAGVRA
jgi:GxxExxY protein